MTASRRRRGPRREIVALVLLACLAGATVSGQPNTDTRKKRVLALFLGRRDAPGFAQADDAFREELERGLAGRLDYVTEYVEPVGSPTTAVGDAVRAAVRTRTREQPFDLIAASSPAGVDIPDDVASVFPDVPVVVTATRSVPAQPGMTGVISDVDFGGTLAAALALRPGIKQVFVVSGSAPFDRSLLRHFTSHVATFATKVTFTELVGLSVPDLKQRLERAATDVIVYYLTVSEDSGGRPLAPFSTLGEIAAVSAAPVFSWHESTLGLGAVGGRLHSSADDGRASARVALRILGGDGVASVPVASVDSHLNAFDWRALQRWGLDEARLPSGGEIRFRRESFFARNRGYVTASLLVLVAQALLIGGLILQRARRRRAEERNTAILRSVPDLMFVLNREGVYLDFHAHRREELFAPPHVFLNRTIRQVMPGPLAETVMDALERSLDGQEPVVVEYELPIAGAVRYFEARLVPAGDGTVLSMVRDVTDSHRAHELNRKLAGRLIATQEEERHRIARELHDDLGQKVALLNIE